MEIFRKILVRKSGRELFKSFKGKIVRVTGTTYITDKDKVLRRNRLAVPLKSNSVGFTGKQSTPVKKGQKRPIMSSSSSTSPEDNRPLKPPTRTRIAALTVTIAIRPRPPTLLSASTPHQSKSVLRTPPKKYSGRSRYSLNSQQH